MTTRNVKYTSRTLKSLIMEARRAGIEVGYSVDMEGKYIISHKIVSYTPGANVARDEYYRPDTCAMAHWMVMGMIAQAKSQICGPFNTVSPARIGSNGQWADNGSLNTKIGGEYDHLSKWR